MMDWEENNMSGNRSGGLKAKQTLLKKDPDFYKNIGAKGGKTPTTKPKGFAANPELARASGAKGGKVSRRRAKKSL